jgi:hypothetical protein
LLLIVVEPGVEVNAVVEAAAAEVEGGDLQRLEHRDSNAEIVGGLLLGEAADHGARQGLFIHRSVRERRRP